MTVKMLIAFCHGPLVFYRRTLSHCRLVCPGYFYVKLNGFFLFNGIYRSLVFLEQCKAIVH